MTKKELPKLIPFGIASILVLTHAFQTLLTPGYVNEEGNEVTYVMADSVLYAGFGLAIVLTLILVNKPAWKYAFAILTVSTFTPWISFYNRTFSFGIGFISFELTALTLLILHLILNPEVFATFRTSFGIEPETEESKERKYELSVKGFERRFDNKSTEELTNIVEQNSLVPEAVEAAKRILERR
ncbi:hypothetical protein [Ekhidna sp.]|uniref:hypothetical protein n=1 Tax=Ekhidna sp. TaxID=2608089 RepID=UPI003B59F29D